MVTEGDTEMKLYDLKPCRLCGGEAKISKTSFLTRTYIRTYKKYQLTHACFSDHSNFKFTFLCDRWQDARDFWNERYAESVNGVYKASQDGAWRNIDELHIYKD